ncbi:helix-turn-helix domain-containing protein [Saccharopolyspora shandongensis]|uniref:helix-turn-helix transcriptional regulator n=1 Tax=Saccharopolyspora shandongensis TaxID=418495 RepID=UPI0034212363
MPRRREYLTIMKVCEELDITRDTFYKWRNKKTAPRCTKLPNGDLRVDRDDFDEWLESRKEAA